MHTNPEVLALLALGEDVGSPAERHHVTSCPACSEEVAELARIADVGRSSPTSDPLSAPSPEVWRRISAELGFASPGYAVTTTPEHRPASLPTGATEVRTRTIHAHSNDPDTFDPDQRDPGEQSPPFERPNAPARQRVSAGRRFVALALAAAVALVAGIGIGIGYERRVAAPQDRVIASAELRPLPRYAGASGTAEVTADGRGGRELIVRMSTATPVNGTVSVWLMDSKGAPTLMGEMKNGEARLPIQRGMSLFERPTVDVSDEPVDDPNPSGHDGTSILRGVLI
jgi:anti-sigma-K factor RskA